MSFGLVLSPASKEDPSCLIIKAMGEPAMLAPQCAAVLTVKVSPRVTVKFALSLGFLSTIPTKIVAQPDVLVRAPPLPCMHTIKGIVCSWLASC